MKSAMARLSLGLLFVAGALAAEAKPAGDPGISGNAWSSSQESLPPLVDGNAPPTYDALWSGYDPRAEPLDVEVLKAWEQDGVVLQVVRYRIGIFKGRKALMAAVYGYPKGGSNLPGLVQIHGGGQYAHSNAVFTNAKRGYATISLAWAGRIDAPGYKVTPKEVQLFWDGATGDPAYKLTTDWGALDAYHAPGRNPKNQFPTIPTAAWTLDAVKSPRNNSWFLCTLGARRALTFLERQPEVDAGKLGVYGHSMGGKLTVLTAGADARVKAAAPSCGGLSDRYNEDPLFRATLGDDVYLRHIACPVMFLSPSNDFHGRLPDLQKAVTEIRTPDWRVTCSPHHNHQDTASYEVATQLWFDQHLRGRFAFPRTPETALSLKTNDGVPVFSVRPDAARRIFAVDIFYSQQGPREAQQVGGKDDREATIARFWHHAVATRNGDTWTAALPVLDTDRPLWAYANVLYALEQPVTGAGYYYRTYATNEFTLSSLTAMVSPAELKAARVKATRQPSALIESFTGDWEKEWFTYKPEEWGRRTHKLHEPEWQAPPGAKLALEVRAAQPNLLVVGIDEHAAEVALAGDGQWQSVVLAASDFHNASGESRPGWAGIKEFRLGAGETLRDRKKDVSIKLGSDGQEAKPEFRNLRWVSASP